MRRLIPFDKVLAEYAAELPPVCPTEIEQSARVEMSDMQVAFIFFRKMALIVAAHDSRTIREKD